MLGAQGALLGTRFYASKEALGHDAAKQRIAAAEGDHTGLTYAFDVVRGLPWPAAYPGRALRNRFMERWDGRERALAEVTEVEGPAYQEAVHRADYETAVVWAGEAVDLVDRVEGAAALVWRISAEAEARLRCAAALVAPGRLPNPAL
jgi:nitronate monooxygenase